MEEGSVKCLPDATKGSAQGPGIWQRLAFSMYRPTEKLGGVSWLMAFLVMNRSGTRTGRFTWLSFALCALAFTLAGAVPSSDRDAISPFVLGLWFLGYPILLLNRLDTSGPTKEEFERARENWLRSRPKLLSGRKRRNTETSGTRRTIQLDPELERLRAESKKLETQIDEVIISLHPELRRANEIVDRIQAIAQSGGFLRPVLLSKVGASSTADALAAFYLVTAETFRSASLNNTPQNQLLLQRYLLAAGGIAFWITAMLTADGRDFAGEFDESVRNWETVDSFVDFLKTIEPSADDYWKKVYVRIGKTYSPS